MLVHVETQLQKPQLERDKANAKSLRDPNAVDYFFDVIMEDEYEATVLVLVFAIGFGFWFWFGVGYCFGSGFSLIRC
jgi:hypothetical protein